MFSCYSHCLERKMRLETGSNDSETSSSGGCGHLVFCLLPWWLKVSSWPLSLLRSLNALLCKVWCWVGEKKFSRIRRCPVECIAKYGWYLSGIHIRKMINCPLKQTSEVQVDYLQCAGVFQSVVSVKGLEQNLDWIFFPNFFSFPLVMHSLLSMW